MWFGFSFCVFLVSKSRTHEIAKNDLEFRIFFLNRRDYRHVPSVPVLCNAEDQTWGFSVLRKPSVLPAELPPQSPAPPLKYQKPGIIAHICNLSTKDAETGASLGYRQVVS